MCADSARRAGRFRLGGRRPQRRFDGQALVETLVVATVLVPLAVLVVLLGKYQSIQSATVAASRSLAFDCATRPSACADPAALGWLVESLRIRHFARPDRAIVSAERAGSTVPADDRHPLWQDRAGRLLLERLQDVDASVAQPRFDAGIGTAVGRAASADVSGIGVAWLSTGGVESTSSGEDSASFFGPLTGFPAASGASPGAALILDRLAGPARFGLTIEGGLLAAQVRVAVAPSHAGNERFARLDPLSLTMHARTAILGDAWIASGPHEGSASVAARTHAGARLDALRETRVAAGYRLTRWAVDLMGAIGLEPTAAAFRYHEIDPEVVPPDRMAQP